MSANEPNGYTELGERIGKNTPSNSPNPFKQKWAFQKVEFPSKELRDTYIRGFIAGLKAIGKEPIEYQE